MTPVHLHRLRFGHRREEPLIYNFPLDMPQYFYLFTPFSLFLDCLSLLFLIHSPVFLHCSPEVLLLALSLSPLTNSSLSVFIHHSLLLVHSSLPSFFYCPRLRTQSLLSPFLAYRHSPAEPSTTTAGQTAQRTHIHPISS
jgi:hypothetical protein